MGHSTENNNMVLLKRFLSDFGRVVDRLEAMSLLLSVVEAGSLSAAGRKLGVPLPTVSRKISDLEAHLNTRLLIRSTRKLALTDLGTAYVAAARRILDEVSEAERAASGEHAAPRGDLVITAPVVFGRLHVLPVIAEFLSQWPEINVRLVLADRNLDLIDDHIDIAVRIGGLADSALVATRVGAVRNVVCGSPAYFAAHGVPKKPEDLSALTAVTFDPFSPSQHWVFRDPKSKRELRVAVRPRLTVNTAEAAIDGAAAGLGVTRVLSYQVTQAISDGRIQIVLAEYEPAPSPVSLIHGPQGLTPLKVRMALDFAAPRLRARLA
jgi:DNA-binding transcriptional LysR family regulator